MKITKAIITTLVLVSSNVAFATACRAKLQGSRFDNTVPQAVVKPVQASTGSVVR